MRKILATILVLACLGWASIARAAEKIRIGFILARPGERYQKDRAYFIEEATKLGASVVFDSCDNSERVQATKVENILTKGIQALVIQPVNSDAAAPSSKPPTRSASRDRYDRIISNADLDYYVTQDSYRVGVLQAEAAVKAIGGKGTW